jgi:BirA family biotin operon repressor/biotin-[acetyl-CoA-carboxylase] ligase
MTTAPELPPGLRLVALDSVGSTNDAARELALDGAPEGTLVWAREQTAGRGRRARGWHSPPGNLYCSVLLRPACPVAVSAQVGFVAAVAIAQALESVGADSDRIRCKWPNDVLLDGRKVAGLLLESQAGPGGGMDWLIVGSGVNIASHPDHTETPATSLCAAGVTCTVEEMLEAYGRFLLEGLATWRNEGFAPVRAAWLARAHGLGRQVIARLNTRTLEGRFAGLDAEGRMILESAAGTYQISAADVFFPANAVSE